MAMPQTIEAVRHPYANGEAKRMLINGEWVRAASGKTFESRNPATGDLLAAVAEGDKEVSIALSLQRGRRSRDRGASSNLMSGRRFS